MFIKTSIFKRILKDAWKGAGLTVGKKEEMYFIQGAYWILFVYEKDFTSKNKAAVIELVGIFRKRAKYTEPMKKEKSSMN